MVKLLAADEAALNCNDLVSFGLLFKTYRYIFEELSPFIHDESVSAAIHQIIDQNTKYLAQSPNENVDLNKVNEFFKKWSNNLNDSLNKCQCPCES